MLNGLSLFSGYGGIDIGLEQWVSPILYCERELYAQGVLISRMDDGTIPFAPIWNDVTTLDGTKLRGLVDLISGGFPCQDISVAGKGKGLAGKRSGLFREIARIAEETEAPILFLENVPAIRTRGAWVVQRTLSRIGYDTRWGTLSAAEVGANHERKRWFCFAIRRDFISDTDSFTLRLKSWWRERKSWKVEAISGPDGFQESLAHTDGLRKLSEQRRNDRASDGRKKMADSYSIDGHNERHGASAICGEQWKSPVLQGSGWWQLEPNVGRVANGVAFRPHRLKAVGNGVVPYQVKKAWEILSCLSDFCPTWQRHPEKPCDSKAFVRSHAGSSPEGLEKSVRILCAGYI